MKGRTYHIFFAWVLLICFIAGQYMIYAHQHSFVSSANESSSIAKNSSGQRVTEKCALCDVMHHNVMVTVNAIYFTPVTSSIHLFKTYNYAFIGIQLILASGRAPPALV